MTIIAIDGPGGSGKSTVARALAARLKLAHLDTGAMYRALSLAALEAGIAPDDGEKLAAMARGLDLEVGERVLVFGRDVTEQIRSEEVNAIVSVVAAHPDVRSELVARQRAWVGAHGGGVVEGRDITSVVLPEADVKLYLTADPAERARRRALERSEGEQTEAGLADQRAAIEARDRLDQERAASPLVRVPDAIEIDTTDQSVEEVVARVLALLANAEAAPTRPASASTAAPQLSLRPISPAARRFYAICRFVAVGLSRLYLPGEVLGRAHLPAEGPYILAPVHRSYVDWLVVARVTRRRLRYMVKEEIWKLKALGRFIELLGAFPVHRASADREALRRCLEVLLAGEPLVLFPEGTRREGASVEELREGAAYLAQRAGVPIVPVGLAGTDRSMPRGARLPRPGRVVIVIGAPLYPSVGEDGRRARVARRATHALNEQLRDALEVSLADALAQQRMRGAGALGSDGDRHGGSEPSDANRQP